MPATPAAASTASSRPSRSLRPGRLTLLYPQWLPGNHGPSGPIASLAGIRVSAGGRTIPWLRDSSYVYAFHVDVPAGVREIRVEFQHLSPTDSGQGRVTMTPAMLNLQWEKMSLYPAGYFTRGIPIQANVTYPTGWTAASSLDVASRAGKPNLLPRRCPMRLWSIRRSSPAATIGAKSSATI